MNTSLYTDDVIFNFFKQICDEKDDQRCVELGKEWIKVMETNLSEMEKNLNGANKLKHKDYNETYILKIWNLLFPYVEKYLDFYSIKTLLTKQTKDKLIPHQNKVLTGGRFSKIKKSIQKKSKKLTYKLYGGNNDILKQLKNFIDRNISLIDIIYYYKNTIDKNNNIFENMIQKYKIN